MATPQLIDIPEAETRELSTNIQAQLSALPTAIDSPETYRRAKESLPILKRMEDRVVLFFRDIKAAAFDAHRKISGKETEQLGPIKQARQRVSTLIYAYEQELDRIKREAEQRAADAERKRREDAAIAEAAAIAPSSPEVADQILMQEIASPAPVIVLPTTTVEVEGVNKARPRWVWRYLGASDHETAWKNLTPSERQRIMGMMPREYLMPNESAITKAVSGSDGAVRIPGVEIYDIGSIGVRGR